MADRFGNAAIVEGDTIIHKNGDFQILTNFLHSDPDHGNYPCWRYSKALEMLSTADNISTDFFKDILLETHTPNTCYSNIHDPENVTIYLYYMHQFENVVTIDLREELKKGDQIIKMSSLFQNSHVTPEYNIANKHCMILYHNYPNPFNAETTIQFALNKSCHVMLKIFDVQGRLIEQLLNTEHGPGRYEVQFKNSELPSGIYFYQLQTGKYSDIKKMIILK